MSDATMSDKAKMTIAPGRQRGAARRDGRRTPRSSCSARTSPIREERRHRRRDQGPVDASSAIDRVRPRRSPSRRSSARRSAPRSVGYKPVAEIMLMNFTTVAMDMIVNHAAKLRFMSGGQTNVPITIRTMTGAGFGTGGQHADYLEAWFAHTAGIKVVAPSNPADAYGLMLSCIDDRRSRASSSRTCRATGRPGAAPERRQPHPARQGARRGARARDVTIDQLLAAWCRSALAAAETLAEEGISVEVIDLRTISPLGPGNGARARSPRPAAR